MNELPLWLQGWLGWIELHPWLSLALLAFAAGVEGLFLVGLIIPGTVLMFAAGALAANGILHPTAVILCAAFGAAVGDAVSFYIGRRYRSELPRLTGKWNVLPRAEQMFARYGGTSLLLGRMIGPIRPIIPAVAGAAGYPPRSFVPMVILASLIWSLAYALPGMAVGATFAVLAEVLGRLSLLLGTGLLVLYLLYKVFAGVLTWSQGHAEPVLLRVIDWSHRHRRLGRLGPALADRDQPETPVLAACLLLLLLVALLAEYTLRSVGGGLGTMQWNLAILDQFAAFRSPWLEQTALQLRTLAQTPMVLAMTGLSSALFFFSGHKREAAHLLAAVIGAAFVFSILGHFAAAPPQALSGVEGRLGGLAELGTAASLSFTLAGLLATRRRRNVKLLLYWTLATVVSLIGLATLLLGELLPDRGLLLMAVSALWASLITLGFRRHQSRRGKPSLLWPHALAVALLPVILPAAPQSIDESLPEVTLLQTRPDRLNLYWEGEPRPALEARGWEEAEPFSWSKTRLYLGDTDFAQLPPVPVLLNGHRPEQVWRRGDEVLRLWALHQKADPLRTHRHWIGHYGRLREQTVLAQARLPLTKMANWETEPLAGTGLEGIPQRYLRTQRLLYVRSF